MYGRDDKNAKMMSEDSSLNELGEFEGLRRRFGDSLWGKFVKGISVSLAIFHLYTAGFGTFPTSQQRSIHLALILLLAYLCFPGSKKFSRLKMHPIDFILALIAFFSNGYVYFYYDRIAAHSGIVTTPDLIVGGIIIIIVLEAVRRTSGNSLPILMIIALIYCYFGPYFPGFLTHNGLTIRRIIRYMVWTTEGIYGIVLGVSSTYLFLFILFGAVLEKTKLGLVINDFAMAIAGHSRGGPAKVAVLASGLMGTISGSAVANVATTGSLTIPLMKKTGFSSTFAASVEAVASTGGMIMPPVMGAAAFVMAEFLGVSYFRIVKAAIIPAFLYFFAAWMVVDFEAARLGSSGIESVNLPKVKDVLIKRGYMLIPIVYLVFLLTRGRTPLYAVFYSIIATLIITSFKKETRLTPTRAVSALEKASMLAVPVASACASVGIMVGMTGTTGLGLILGHELIKIAGGNFYLTLFFSMIASLVLGMGLSSTPCYIIVATLLAPALVSFGMSGIPVHLFVFYFGILSVITPPVCMASYTAAGIANANPAKVGFLAFRLALAGFLIPYVFITSPSLLLINPTAIVLIPKLITAILGVICMAAMAIGYWLVPLRIYERILLLFAGISLMFGGILTDLLGISIMGVILVKIKLLNKKKCISNR